MAKKETSREPRQRKLLLALWALALAGLLVSAYLTWVYYATFRDFYYSPGCNLNSEWSCTAVAGSPYARILCLPNSLYGMAVYLLVLALIPLRLRARIRAFAHLENYLVLLGLFCIGISAYLAYASFFILHKHCIFCMCLYAINIAFLVLALLTVEWKALSQQIRDDLKLLKTDPKVLGPAILLLIAAAAFVVIQHNRCKNEKQIPPGPGRPGVTISTASDPSLGPPRAPIVIIEFSDFQCPYCREMHFVLKKLREKHPDQIRVVFKNFPLDPVCNPRLKHGGHPNSCLAAFAAECAHQMGAFEKLYEKLATASNYSPEGLLGLASDSGMDLDEFQQCMISGQIREEVQRDIADALKLGIQGTPLLVVNGRVYYSALSEPQLEILISELLAGKEPSVPTE